MATHKLEPIINKLISAYEAGDSTNTMAHQLDRELFALATQSNQICVCQRNLSTKEPGKHHPACDLNPAHRPGDWS